MKIWETNKQSEDGRARVWVYIAVKNPSKSPSPSTDKDLDAVPGCCTAAARCSPEEDGLNAKSKFHGILCICDQ